MYDTYVHHETTTCPFVGNMSLSHMLWANFEQFAEAPDNELLSHTTLKAESLYLSKRDTIGWRS